MRHVLRHAVLIALHLLLPLQSTRRGRHEACRYDLDVVLVHAVGVEHIARLPIERRFDSREVLTKRQRIHRVRHIELIEGEGYEVEQREDASAGQSVQRCVFVRGLIA